MSLTREWAPPVSVSPVGEGLGVCPVELCVLRAGGACSRLPATLKDASSTSQHNTGQGLHAMLSLFCVAQTWEHLEHLWQIFTWVLEIRTQVLKFVQVLLLTRPHPYPQLSYFCKYWLSAFM